MENTNCRSASQQLRLRLRLRLRLPMKRGAIAAKARRQFDSKLRRKWTSNVTRAAYRVLVEVRKIERLIKLVAVFSGVIKKKQITI